VLTGVYMQKGEDQRHFKRKELHDDRIAIMNHSWFLPTKHIQNSSIFALKLHLLNEIKFPFLTIRNE
jgi:hypothetical protein